MPKENGGWLPHLHLQLIAYSRLDDITPIPGVGEEAYLDLWSKSFTRPPMTSPA